MAMVRELRAELEALAKERDLYRDDAERLALRVSDLAAQPATESVDMPIEAAVLALVTIGAVHGIMPGLRRPAQTVHGMPGGAEGSTFDVLDVEMPDGTTRITVTQHVDQMRARALETERQQLQRQIERAERIIRAIDRLLIPTQNHPHPALTPAQAAEREQLVAELLAAEGKLERLEEPVEIRRTWRFPTDPTQLRVFVAGVIGSEARCG